MGVNRVILLGNLGADPELRHTANGTAVANLSIATTERRKGADGEWADHTEWHRVIVFGKQAENCTQYLAKGRQAYIEGRIQTRKWQDKQGQDRYTTEVLASTVQFIGGRGDSAGGGYNRGLSDSVSQQSVTSSSPIAASGIPLENVAFDDDDIPF